MAKYKIAPRIEISLSDAEVISSDFKVFCNYILEHKVRLSRGTGHIGKKDCFELNKLFYRQEEYERATRFQTNYPMIQFFYYVAIKHEILEINKNGTGIMTGRNYTLYQNASVMEQYTLFLLNFLYDAGFLKDGSAPFHIHHFFSWFSRKKPKAGKVYEVDFHVFPHDFTCEGGITAHLEELRLIRIEKKASVERGDDFPLWKIEVLPALQAVYHLYEKMSSRQDGLWNRYERIEFNFDPYMNILDPAQDKHMLADIFVPVSVEIGGQTVDLKVSMRDYDCSRTIRMNLSDSLYELHMMIQAAFNFDNDHLFEFYVGRRPFQKSYTIPEGITSGEEFSVEDTALGHLELARGQRFTYLFDFGDNWWFDIEVVKIAEGKVSGPLVIQSENDAPEQYPMCDEEWDVEEWDEEKWNAGEWDAGGWDEDEVYDEDAGHDGGECGEDAGNSDDDYEEMPEEYEAKMDPRLTVAAILASIEDDFIQDQYAALCRPQERDTDSLSPTEQRRAIEQVVCQEPDRMLVFITKEMSEMLNRLIHRDSFSGSEICRIAGLYSFGFCMISEKDGHTILVPECIRDIYAPKLRNKETLPDQFSQISELLLRRCGVIELKSLFSAAGTILKRKIKYEEYTFCVFSRLHYFGNYFMDCIDGTDYVSCYERELTEKILEERRKPENRQYQYPEFGKMKKKELKEQTKEIEAWKNYICIHLYDEPEAAFWLSVQIPLLASSGVVKPEEILEIYKNTVQSVGSHMTKEASGMIQELCNTLPLAVRFGHSASDEPGEYYQQISLFD